MLKTNNSIMSIALTNLHQYNCGILNFVWLDLPATAEEIAAAYDAISISHDGVNYYDECGAPMEEAFITDYECDFMKIKEYTNIESLNEIAETIESFDDYDKMIIKALLDDGFELNDAIEKKDDCIYYDNCDSMADVAEQYLEETGILNEIPENLRYYFDFDSYGRDMSFEGHWIATDNGYIEVIY